MHRPEMDFLMMTSSNGNIFRVTGPLWGEAIGHQQIPFTKASDAEFDVFFDLRLNKLLRKQSQHRWFEMPPCSFWRHCYDNGSVCSSTPNWQFWAHVLGTRFRKNRQRSFVILNMLLVNIDIIYLLKDECYCCYSRTYIVNRSLGLQYTLSVHNPNRQPIFNKGHPLANSINFLLTKSLGTYDSNLKKK